MIKDKQLLFKANLQRPNDAKVSNNGIVICCDWLNSQGLTGKFVIFDAAGELLFAKKMTANLGNNAISPNGLYALFETYNSDTAHSDQFFIIDIPLKSIIGKFERPHAFRTATIQESQKRILLNIEGPYGFHL